MFEVGDLVRLKIPSNAPFACNSWRVTHHLKLVYEDEMDWGIEPGSIEATAKEIMDEIIEEERQDRKKKGQPAGRRFKLMYCLPEEATHISGYGLMPSRVPVREGDEVDSIGDNGVTLADGTYLAYSRLAKILMEFDLSTISAIGSFRKQPAFVREHIAGTLKESGRLLLGAYPTPDWLVWGD